MGKTHNFRCVFGNFIRRDLLLNIVWLVVFVSMIEAGLVKLVDLYGNDASVLELVKMFDTPMMTAFFGKIPQLAHYNTAIIFAVVMLPMMGVLSAIMSIQIAVKGTRLSEENGATELLLSRAISKRTPVFTSMLEIIVINMVSVLLMFLCMVTRTYMHGNLASDSFVFSALIGSIGILFGGITLFFAQLFRDVRSVNMASYTMLGIAYFLRSFIDVKNWQAVAFLSPFNWLENAKVFYQLNVWYLAFGVVVGIIFSLIAIVLAKSRDLNAGLIEIGNFSHKRAPYLLRGFVSLFIRTERKTASFWLIGLLAITVMFGSLSANLKILSGGSQNMMKMLGINQTDVLQKVIVRQFFVMASVMTTFFSILAGFVIIQRERKDARTGALEVLLAKPISRLKVYLTYTLGGLLASVVIFSSGYFVLAILTKSQMTKMLTAKFLWHGYGDYLVVILVALSFGALLIGCIPSIYPIIFGYVSIFFMLVILKDLFKIPLWVLKLSPFGWVYNTPVTTVSIGVVIGMILVTSICFVLGFMGYNRRDLV